MTVEIDGVAVNRTEVVLALNRSEVLLDGRGARGVSGQITVSSAVGQAVSSRIALAAIASPINGQLAILTESGRDGWFVFDSSDLSAKVTVDTVQGVYVAPGTAPTGSSGAWVRRFSGALDIRWFGGVADALASGTGTNNTPAFNAALACAAVMTTSAAVIFPAAAGHYRFSTAPNEITTGVKLFGQGWHENPGIVNGATKAFPQNYTGSVCRFDADVKGFVFSAFTDNLATAVAYEFESSSYSIIEDLMVMSLGGTGTTSHGLDVFATIRARNVRVYGFAGNNLNINANTGAALRYGNADLSLFSACLFQAAKLHGVYLDGDNANVIEFDACSFSNNGGCGSLDTTVVGNNLFAGCHYTTNNQSYGTPAGYSAAQRAKVVGDAPCLSDQYTGSAIQYRLKDYSGADIGNLSSYVGCYNESGTGSLARLRHPTTYLSGFLSQTGSWHSEFTAEGIGRATRLSGVAGETKVYTPSGLSQFIVEAGDGSFVNLQLKNNTGTVLDLLSIGGITYVSADSIYWRKADQTTALANLDDNGLNLTSAVQQLRMNGTKVVGTRLAAITAGVNAAAAPTNAEFNALVAVVNSLRTALSTHGLTS